MDSDKEKWFKRAFTVTWILLFILIGITAWFLVKNYNREPDVNNYIGKSAYQLAVEHGFKGNEVMWLDSLKASPATKPVNGVDGRNGRDGKDGKNGKDSVSTHTETNTITEREVITEKQVKGDRGEDGRTPHFAQDSITNKLFYKYDGDDEWQPLPLLCLGTVCGGSN